MEALVQRQYDRLATIYDRRWRFYISNTLSFLAHWAELSPQDRVLDVACGTGEFERLLLAQYPDDSRPSIVGIDFSASMVAVARQKALSMPNVTFQEASATALPWPAPRFNVVICANSFHYFDQPQTVLAEMRRVLDPDGKVIILDWCRDFLICRICDWILGWLDPAYRRCYAEAELHHLLVGNGYTLRRSRRVRFGLIWGLMAVEATMDDGSRR